MALRPTVVQVVRVTADMFKNISTVCFQRRFLLIVFFQDLVQNVVSLPKVFIVIFVYVKIIYGVYIANGLTKRGEWSEDYGAISDRYLVFSSHWVYEVS